MSSRGGELIEQLWTEDRVNFEGDYYQPSGRRSTTSPMTRYRSSSPPSGPLAAKLAGRAATGSSPPAAKIRTSTKSCSRPRRGSARPPAATRRGSTSYRDQGLLRHDAEFALECLRAMGGAGADPRPESRDRRPDRDGTGRRHTPTGPRRGSSSPTTPTRSSRGSPPTSNSASTTSSSTPPATTRGASCAVSAPTCCRAARPLRRQRVAPVRSGIRRGPTPTRAHSRNVERCGLRERRTVTGPDGGGN